MASYTKIKANNKQGYKWICTLEGPPDPVTGKRKQIPRRGDSQKEALARAEKALDDYIKHDADSRTLNKVVFEEAGEEWLKDYAKTKVKERTVDIRKAELKVINSYYGKVPVIKLTYKHHQNMLNDLDDKDYATTTIKGINSTAKMVIKYAIKHKWRLDNPFIDTFVPAKILTIEEIENDPIQEKILERNELEEFLWAAQKYGLYMDNEIFHLLAFSGMRSGELCALKDTDFFFDSNEIRITKTVYYPKNNMRKYKLTPPKTKGSIRRIGIIDTVMSGLEKHILTLPDRRAEFKKVFDDYEDKNFVFGRKNGYPNFPKRILDRMVRLLAKTSIKKEATPHIFRHTHISMLAEAEVDLKTIMDRVGHDDAKTTLKIYTHVTHKMKINASEKIKERFGNLVKI
ncbi:tyrosine-type recombinase/integrase [Paenibacillus massiliensis]|uniref:tyrosine-type recombinase/integrase n=1 Tax=Paenibacillus massiliensis TaxID=225917 RepID=UPI00042035D8|nr:site-specific integrase [Paenibacillus massiliensis]